MHLPVQFNSSFLVWDICIWSTIPHLVCHHDCRGERLFSFRIQKLHVEFNVRAELWESQYRTSFANDCVPHLHIHGYPQQIATQHVTSKQTRIMFIHRKLRHLIFRSHHLRNLFILWFLIMRFISNIVFISNWISWVPYSGWNIWSIHWRVSD